MSVIAAGLLQVSVIALVAGALTGLKMWLAHREKSFEHKPLAEMQRKLDDLEAKIFAGAMRR